MCDEYDEKIKKAIERAIKTIDEALTDYGRKDENDNLRTFLIATLAQSEIDILKKKQRQTDRVVAECRGMTAAIRQLNETYDERKPASMKGKKDNNNEKKRMA